MAPRLSRRPLTDGSPPPAVLDAFGVAAARRLPGGRSGAFHAGDVVLKATEEREGTWLAQILHDLPEPPDLRIIRPVVARDGRWIVDGWAAWAWLEGATAPTPTAERLDIARRFHAAVGHVERPPHLADHAWSRGHAWAWDEIELDVPASYEPVAAAIRERVSPVDLPCQLVHGDLAGNLLHHPTLPPAVIDVSPCWRPARYGEAIVVVDRIAWWDAPLEDIGLMRENEDLQLLLRAVLFRLGTAAVLCADDPVELADVLRSFEPVAGRLLRQVP